MAQITGVKFAIAAALALSLTIFTAFPGASSAHDMWRQAAPAEKQNQQPRQSKDAKPVASFAEPYIHAKSVLWREPVDLESRDLFYGAGGRAGAPDPSTPFTYVRRSKSGTQKKIIVQDIHGDEWTVKFGLEARPETAATRIVWAVGYHVDHDYFVPRARIVGQKNIDACDVRFERRGGGYKEVGHWSWETNPFVGTRELEGLKVVMALLKNWDLKKSNNDILIRKKKPGPSIYYVADLGATLGRTGTVMNGVFGNWPGTISVSPGKSKGDPSAFARERFITEVCEGRVYFYNRNSNSRRRMNGVSIASARWMGALLGRLSNKQLADAFCASGFDKAETDIYVSILRARIIQLQQL